MINSINGLFVLFSLQIESLIRNPPRVCSGAEGVLLPGLMEVWKGGLSMSEGQWGLQ